MRRFASILTVLLLLAMPALAQSTVEQFSPVPTFPLPDPAVTTSHLWITQVCATSAACDYKIDPLSLGSPYQAATAPSVPYPNQLWWDTSTSPATLRAFQNSVWTPVSSRIRLTATGNLYVAPSGSDTNNTCASSIAPCATLKQAVSVAQSNYDVNGHLLNINLGNGTYSAGALVVGPIVGQGTVGSMATASTAYISGLQILGNVGSPSAVTIADTSSATFPAVIAALYGGQVNVQGVTLSSVNGFDLFAGAGSSVSYSNVIFGFAGTSQVSARGSGAVAQALGSYTISGNTAAHLDAELGGNIILNTPSTVVTLSGTPAFGNGFAFLDAAYATVNSADVTFSGAGTGPRFNVFGNSYLETGSVTPNPTFLPGNAVGVLSTGGRYNPPLPPTVTAATGLGSGGSAAICAGSLASAYGGCVALTAGTSGTASTGSFTLTYASATIGSGGCVIAPTAGFAAGATANYSSQQGSPQTGVAVTVVWVNGPGSAPGNLTANAVYYLNFACSL